MKKIFFWSPHLSNVATIKNVINSAMSLKKYYKKSLDVSIIDVVGEWLKYKNEICAIMCFGFTNEIPKSVTELDLMTKDAHLQSIRRDQKVGKIAIAYTVWSKKKGGGKLIVKEVFKKIKKSNHLNRLVTLSPLTEMARNFHLRNGAIELQVNKETQNFEYKI